MRKSQLDLEQYMLEKLSIDLLINTEKRNELEEMQAKLVEKIKNIKQNMNETTVKKELIV